MKRILPILLILAMLLSFAVTGSADAQEPETVPTAPVLRAVQSAVNQDDATRQDIRFLATVSSLSGSALGMNIRATFTTQDGETHSVTYGADDGLEGNTVYSSVMANVNGEKRSVSAAELANSADAIAIYAVAIRNVPTDVDVMFTVRTYLKNGESEIESAASAVSWTDGKLTDDFRVVYREDFSDMTLNASLTGNANSGLYADETKDAIKSFNEKLIPLGWKLNSTKGWGTGAFVTVADGQATLNGQGTTYRLVGADALKTAQVYSIDLDLTAKSIGSVLSLFFNNSTDVGYYAGAGQFVRLVNTNGKIALRTGVYARKADTTDYAGANIVTASDVSTEAMLGERFHLTLLVNRKVGTVAVLVNGKQALTVPVYYIGGGLEMHIQDAETVIDNVVILADNPQRPSDGTVLFSENFDSYPNGAKPYTKSDNIIGNEPNASVTNGVLYLPSEWAVYRAVGDSALADADRYVLEMDVKTDNLGFFNVVFNHYRLHPTSKSLDGLGTFNVLQFRATKSPDDTDPNGPNVKGPLKANLLTYEGGKVKSFKSFGFVNAEESYESTPTEERSYTFRFALEVDKTAGTVSLFVNGVLVGTLQNSEAETILYKNAGGVYFWTQSTGEPVQVDNIRVVAGSLSDLSKKGENS